MSSSKKESSKKSDPDIYSLDKQIDTFLFELKSHMQCHSDYDSFMYKQNLLDAAEGTIAMMREWYCE